MLKKIFITIVILSTLTLVILYIVPSKIKESKKASTLRSAELYINSINNSLKTQNLDLEDNWYNINNDGNVCLDNVCSKVVELDIKNKPTRGRVYLRKNLVKAVSNIKYNEFLISTVKNELSITNSEEKYCIRRIDSEGYDTVTCGNETFFVISETIDTVTLLSKYNLNVGNKQIITKVYGDFVDKTLIPIESPTGIQMRDAKGYIADNQPSYGVVSYKDGYEHVRDYGDYLRSYGISSVKTRMMTYDEVITLKCNETSCNKAYPWVYSTSYWIESELGVVSSGYLSNIQVSDNENYGVRPVVTISKDEIEISSSSFEIIVPQSKPVQKDPEVLKESLGELIEEQIRR